MFSGIIEKKGQVKSIVRRDKDGVLVIDGGTWDRELVIGESIAVNGVCLTLTRHEKGLLSFDVLNETFERTNLGDHQPGMPVNLERSLRVGDTVGGHFVTGHVDGTGVTDSFTPVGRDRIWKIACGEDLTAGMVPKGSIACDGISLTIVDLGPGFFTVHLIPHTCEVTNLSAAKPGNRVNLETDMLGKYVKRILTGSSAGQPGLTWEKLKEHGFGG